MEQIEEQFKEVFDELPEPISVNSTFLEIAGFPHYENVCSNILKYFFTPNPDIYDLNKILYDSLLEAADIHDVKFSPTDNIKIKREVVTSSGRLDLLIFSPDYAIVIENKIYHHLNNDLNEYSQFVENSYKRNKVIKIVLSLRKEEEKLKGGFTNVTYKNLIDIVESRLQSSSINQTDSYFIFKHFIQTIKNLYKNTTMEKTELDFLIKNQDKIQEVIDLENKFSLYINQRATNIMNSVTAVGFVDKWVYQGYSVGFHFEIEKVRYKLECFLTKNGISIVICVEPNRIDFFQLGKLEFFKSNGLDNYKPNLENNRIIIKEDIDIFIDDSELISMLDNVISQIKVTEVTNEQLN